MPIIAQTDAPDSESIPDVLLDNGADPDTARVLGDSDYGTHWVATDPEGNICIASQLYNDSEDNWVDASSCTPPDIFNDHGIYVAAGGEGLQSATAYLLPPDVDASELASTDGFELLSTDPQPVAVVGTKAPGNGSPITLPREGSGTFELSGTRQ